MKQKRLFNKQVFFSSILSGCLATLVACAPSNENLPSKPTPTITSQPNSKPSLYKEDGVEVVRGGVHGENLDIVYNEETKEMTLKGQLQISPYDGGPLAVVDISLAGQSKDFHRIDLKPLPGDRTTPPGMNVAARATCLDEAGGCSASFVDIYVQYNDHIYHHQVETLATKDTTKSTPYLIPIDSTKNAKPPTILDLDKEDDMKIAERDDEGESIEDDDDYDTQQGHYIGDLKGDLKDLFNVDEKTTAKAAPSPSPSATPAKDVKPAPAKDVKTEPKSEVKTAPATPAAPKGTPKTTTKEAPKPAPKEAPKTAPAKPVEVKPAPVKPVPVKTTQPEPIGVKPIPKPEPQPEKKAEVKPPLIKQEPKEEPKAAPKAEVKPEPKKEVKPEPKAEEKSEEKKETEEESKPETKPAQKESSKSANPFTALSNLGKKIYQVMGSASSGFLQNALNLFDFTKKPKPAGFYISRPHLKTSFGSNEMIFMIQKMGTFTLTHMPEYSVRVGDLSAERGGVIYTKYRGKSVPKHRSHKSGVDADISYYFKDQKDQGQSALTKNGTPREDWLMEQQWELFKMFNETKLVDRIFIHRKLKKALCLMAIKNGEVTKETTQGVAYETLWRLQPRQSDHADHFHLRVKCSSIQQACKAMPDPVRTTGCF